MAVKFYIIQAVFKIGEHSQEIILSQKFSCSISLQLFSILENQMEVLMSGICLISKYIVTFSLRAEIEMVERIFISLEKG